MEGLIRGLRAGDVKTSVQQTMFHYLADTWFHTQRQRERTTRDEQDGPLDKWHIHLICPGRRLRPPYLMHSYVRNTGRAIPAIRTRKCVCVLFFSFHTRTH